MLPATAATAQLSEIAHVGRGETGNFTMQIQLPRPGPLLSSVSLVAVVADDGRGDGDDYHDVPLPSRTLFLTLYLPPPSFFFIARVSAKNQSAATRRAVHRSRLSYHSRRIRIRDFLTASDAAALRFLLRFIAKSFRGGRRAPRLSFTFLFLSLFSSPLSLSSRFSLAYSSDAYTGCVW